MLDALSVPRIPLAQWINEFFFWLRTHFRGGFRAVSAEVEAFVTTIQNILLSSLPVVFGVIVVLALVAGGWRLGLFAGLGFGLIVNLGLWRATMETLALVLAAGVVCLAIGVPAGVATAKSQWVKRVARPTLDFMQTMPAFVYLIPAISFFRVGPTAGLFATVIFALPPVVRLVAHGIEHVDRETVEASEAFGASGWQTLVKVQLPLARPSIMVGVNQTLMMSLSMAVIAAMVGAQGLGAVVVSGISNVNAGVGFEGGISVVILAVVLDRVTQAFGAPRAADGRKAVFSGLGRRMKQLAMSIAGTRPVADEWLVRAGPGAAHRGAQCASETGFPPASVSS